jgi:ABC-2 type transport system ATP-binding protein
MANVVEVKNVVKTYADKVAVDDLSFSIAKGEVFGLIGPNGAGKTTTIKMMMDIIKPDSVTIEILGEKISEATKDKLGYMPEERGLYKKQRVLDTIIYFATLKGVKPQIAEQRANQLLGKTDMLPNARKKIEELSKGMSQIIQFIVTIIHEPQLIILDEPFGGLDPVNTELLKNMLLELRREGKAIILSTHQMNQIEALCDRILMVNHGRSVLYGPIADIKSKYRSNSVVLDYQGELGKVPGVVEQREYKDHVELMLDGKTTPQQVLKHLLSRGIVVNRFEIATPPLNEIFLKVVGKDNE